MPNGPDLDALFNPRAIAVVGASATPGRVGNLVFEGLIASGRTLYPVHPGEGTIHGHAAVREVDALPDGVDLAVITVAAERAVDAAEACARRGIPFLIVVAGGFGETGAAGKALEARLAAIPERFGSRILGPNTLGIYLPHAGIDTLFVEHAADALAGGGGVAFVAQSGSVGVEALSLASNIGFGLRAFVGLGNKCDLDELDFLGHFAADDATACLGLYVENFERGRAFLEAAARVSRRKPVVVLKAGHTDAGAAAVSSHTGQLAGADRVVDGAFRQFGIQRAFDDEELCDATRTLAALPPASGSRVAIVTPAGAYGVMGADHVETPARRGRISMATLTEATRERIRAVTPDFAAVGNPVDLTAVADDSMFAAALDALLEDDGVDIILVAAFFAPPGVTDGLVGVVAERVRRGLKPIVAFTEYGPKTDAYLRRLYEAGVIGFPSVGRAVRAARFLVERAERRRALGGPS